MATTLSHEVVDRFYRLMANEDFGALVDTYDPDAQIIRFDGTARGPDEIAAFLRATRQRHAPYELSSVDQLTESGGILMWDAMVDTHNGLLLTTEVFVFGGNKIVRHIPGIRGYWGR